MGARRKLSFTGLWGSLYPVLLYLLMQVAASVLYGIGMGVYGVVTGIPSADLTDYIMDRYMEGTVTIVLIAALITIPLYAWLYYRDVQKKRWMGFREDWFPLTEWTLLWAVLGSAALAMLGNGLISLLPLAQWSDSYEDVSDALYMGSIWLRMASVGIFGPIVEELTMRGLMYQRFRMMMRPVTAMFWSALVFGVFHGNIVQGVYAFLVGLFFAWLMERTQRILVPVIGHMSANLFIVLLEEESVLEFVYGSIQNFLLCMLFCAILFVCSIRAIQGSRTA